MLQERKQQKQTSTEFEISCEACVLSKFVILIDIDSGFCYRCKENVNHHNFFFVLTNLMKKYTFQKRKYSRCHIHHCQSNLM